MVCREAACTCGKGLRPDFSLTLFPFLGLRLLGHCLKSQDYGLTVSFGSTSSFLLASDILKTMHSSNDDDWLHDDGTAPSEEDNPAFLDFHVFFLCTAAALSPSLCVLQASSMHP